MKKFGLLTVLALSSILSGGATVSGGSATITGSGISSLPSCPGRRLCPGVELIRNGGFEDGTLAPWTTNNWEISTSSPHQGSYCAADSGNFWIQQDIVIPAFLIEHVTFWSRQIASPQSQAYDFFYADSSFEEFAITPGPSWTQYDVTANLDSSKVLVAFRLWGNSSIGGVDSTYVDDVSISATRISDVGIVWLNMPRDTIPFGTVLYPGACVRNYGNWPESVWVWFRIEHTCSSYVHRDSKLVVLEPGEDAAVDFDSLTLPYSGLYRWQITLDTNDTNWYCLYVRAPIGVDERAELRREPSSLSIRPTVGREFLLYCSGATGVPSLGIYDAAGLLVWRRDLLDRDRSPVEWHGTNFSGVPLPPGVYLARIGTASARLVLTE